MMSQGKTAGKKAGWRFTAAALLEIKECQRKLDLRIKPTRRVGGMNKEHEAKLSAKNPPHNLSGGLRVVEEV